MKKEKVFTLKENIDYGFKMIGLSMTPMDGDIQACSPIEVDYLKKNYEQMEKLRNEREEERQRRVSLDLNPDPVDIFGNGNKKVKFVEWKDIFIRSKKK